MTGATKLYRYYDAAGELLYVGISNNALRRLAQHEASKTWQDNVTRVEIEAHPTREAALGAERRAIASENPIHNLVRYTRDALSDWEQSDGSMRIPHTKRFKGREIVSYITLSAQEWAEFSANLGRVLKNDARMKAKRHA